MRLAALIAPLFVIAAPTLANATCSTAHAAGTWELLVTLPTFNKTDLCLITLGSTGKITAATCASGNKVTGSATLSSACAFAATITINGAITTKIAGRTDSGPNIILAAGDMKNVSAAIGFRK